MIGLRMAGDTPLIRCVYGRADGSPLQVANVGRRKGEVE